MFEQNDFSKSIEVYIRVWLLCIHTCIHTYMYILHTITTMKSSSSDLQNRSTVQTWTQTHKLHPWRAVNGWTKNDSNRTTFIHYQKESGERVEGTIEEEEEDGSIPFSFLLPSLSAILAPFCTHTHSHSSRDVTILGHALSSSGHGFISSSFPDDASFLHCARLLLDVPRRRFWRWPAMGVVHCHRLFLSCWSVSWEVSCLWAFAWGRAVAVE